MSKYWRSGAIPVQQPSNDDHLRHRRREASAHEGFSHWWRGVLEGAALLPPEVEENIDYVGQMPWPELVAVETLYAAYVAVVRKAGHETYSSKNFRKTLVANTEMRYHSVRNILVKTHSTRRQAKRLEAFYSTGKRQGGLTDTLSTWYGR